MKGNPDMKQYYVITVERHTVIQDAAGPERGKEIDQKEHITFPDNQIGARLYHIGIQSLAENIMPCEGCRYEDRSKTRRPCFDCRRIKPDMYESIYQDDAE